jgi:hypothetical protein
MKHLKAVAEMVLVLSLGNLPVLSAWGDTDEQWVCGDSLISERQIQREFKGQPESPALTFTIAGLTLNKSLIRDAEAKFGPPTQASSSHPDGGLDECYKSAKWPDDPSVVTLTTGVTTDFHELTGFRLESDSSPGAGKCVTSSLVSSDLGTGNGLRLGLSQTDVQKILGPGRPGARRTRRWFYSGEIPNDAAEAKRTGETYYLKDSIVSARFRDSKADCISVWQVESY